MASLALPATLWGQPLQGTETNGYLDFLGGTSGAPTTVNIVTGPYRAAFGSSAADALTKSPLDVYCIDWMGRAGDGFVRIYTFQEALTLTTGVAPSFRDKLLTGANVANTTVAQLEADLNSAAWLTTQMSPTAKSQWDEQHIALWGLFWNAGTPSPALPSYTTYGTTGGDTKSAQQWYNDAIANSNFNTSNFRIFVPVTITGGVESFDASRQIFLTQVVPEPGTWALMMVGLGAMGVMARRQVRRRSSVATSQV